MSSNHDQILEDQPIMRSVAMMPPPSLLSVPRSQPLMKSHAATVTSHHDVKQAPKPAGWDVCEPIAIPFYYQLERTHVYISDATPQVVAQRIANCLKMESIAATFHEDEALLDAETRCGVQFCVRLWLDKNEVVAEVQRVCGCCYQYCQTAKMVLRSAKGMVAEKPPPKPMRLPRSIPQDSIVDQEKCMDEGLSIASAMLKDDRLDTNALALESLVKLSSVPKCRAYAARTILKGELFDAVLSRVESFRAQENDLSECERKLNLAMHRHALTVMANCLHALHERNELSKMFQEHQDELQSHRLLSVLVAEMSACNKRPHDACEAVRCLQALIGASLEAKQRVMDLGMSRAVSGAYDEGLSRHMRLHKESQKLQVILGDF